MKRIQLKWLVPGILFLIGVFFSGCVSSPPPVQEPVDDEPKTVVQQAPDWFFTPPKDDAKYKYYVGSGISKTGSLTEAENNATQDIIDSILLYIGVQVTSDTTAVAKASIDSFQSDLTQVVTTKGEAKVSGFEIVEKLPHERGDEIILYLLCRYDKQEIEAEKRRIEKIFAEQYDAYFKPFNKGKDLLADKQYFDSTIQFIEAASVAANEKLVNPQEKFEGSISFAKEAVERINLIKLTDIQEGTTGKELPEPFKVKVVTGGSESDRGVEGVSVRISYKTLNSGKTRLITKSTSRKTDSDGYVSFTHPVPEFTGDSKVTVVLDFDAYLEVLNNVPNKWYDAVEALESLIARKRVTFDFKVISKAKGVNTGIVIVDLDMDNVPVKEETTAAVVQTLTVQKYKIRKLSVKPDDLLEKSDFDIISMLADRFSKNVQRAIFGTAKLLDFSERDGQIFAQCSATVQIVDLSTQEVLLTVVKTARGMGATRERALSAAFTNIGKAIGKDILNNLR